MPAMDVSHNDNLSDSSSLPTSELFLVDLVEFDNLDLLDEFHQFGNMNVSEMFPGDANGCTTRNGSKMRNVVEISAIDQPATSTSTDSEHSAESSTKLRRRAQNRASQRAFRERKEKHLRSLKSTLENLGDKHRRLLDSYSQQSEVVTRLKGRIADLHAQIAAFSTYSEQDMTNLSFRIQRPSALEFHQFDAFSFSSTSGPASHPRAFRQSRTLDGNGLEKLPSLESYDLPEFEDLLNLP